MVQPNIGWIMPDGEYVEIANQGYTHEAYATYVLRNERRSERDYEDEALELISRGWIRYTGGNVEGMQQDIIKQWDVIRKLVEEDLASGAYSLTHAEAYFDVYLGEYPMLMEKEHRTFHVPISQMLHGRPPTGVYREPTPIHEFRNRRPVHQAKVAVRRHLRHPPGMCLCHRSKTVNQVRRKIVRRLRW